MPHTPIVGKPHGSSPVTPQLAVPHLPLHLDAKPAPPANACSQCYPPFASPGAHTHPPSVPPPPPCTSWMLKLEEVQTPELAEVFAINTLAPFILNSRLQPLMRKRGAGQEQVPRFIVNVSAMEGKFYRFKSACWCDVAGRGVSPHQRPRDVTTVSGGVGRVSSGAMKRRSR